MTKSFHILRISACIPGLAEQFWPNFPPESLYSNFSFVQIWTAGSKIQWCTHWWHCDQNLLHQNSFSSFFDCSVLLTSIRRLIRALITRKNTNKKRLSRYNIAKKEWEFSEIQKLPTTSFSLFVTEGHNYSSCETTNTSPGTNNSEITNNICDVNYVIT